jgi:hypothetical protein
LCCVAAISLGQEDAGCHDPGRSTALSDARREESGTLMTFRQPKASVARPSLSSRAYGLLKSGAVAAQTYSKLHDRFTFDDRRTGARTVVIMLAGYKRDLWPLVFPRFKAALPEADVCLVSPGLRNEALAELCRREGWSYLATATNDVSLAQNVCFRLHDRAEMIIKLDEDMFVLRNTMSDLLAEYKRIKREGRVDPGFVAPMIPLNGFCYRHLLEMLGLLDEYEAQFGTARLATAGLPLHDSPLAARWIWEHTAPLEGLVQRLQGMPRRELFSPIQFSIGIIAFERRFWEQIGYFAVPRHKLMARMSTLGGDEACLCAAAMVHARPIVVTTAALAGHFSFGPQYAAMKELLQSNPEIFA